MTNSNNNKIFFFVSLSALLALSVISMTTMATTTFADPKANRTYYYFGYDYIDQYTGELVTNTRAHYNTLSECEDNRVAYKELENIVRVDDSCGRIKLDNPHNPK